MQNSSPILRWKFLARKGAKFIANASATKVTSLPSLSLSLSLSLYLSLSPHAPHAQYRKRFRASYNTLVWKSIKSVKTMKRSVLVERDLTTAIIMITPRFSLLQWCTCTDWCSEIGSLTSLDACNSGASSDVREPISLHQAVCIFKSAPPPSFPTTLFWREILPWCSCLLFELNRLCWWI